jgi:hypothetical protein
MVALQALVPGKCRYASQLAPARGSPNASPAREPNDAPRDTPKILSLGNRAPPTGSDKTDRKAESEQERGSPSPVSRFWLSGLIPKE